MCLSYSDPGILEKIKEPKPFLDGYLAAIKSFTFQKRSEKSQILPGKKCRKSICMKQTTLHLSKILNIVAKITFAQSKLRTPHSIIYLLDKPKMNGKSSILA